MKNNKDNVYDCTSNNFDGIIAVMSPEDSWVCKWQRISKILNYEPVYKLLILTIYLSGRFTRGIYAISVSGRLPKGIIRDMKHRGIPYRLRDTSQR